MRDLASNPTRLAQGSVPSLPRGVEIGTFRPADEPSIFACMRAAFGVEPDVETWRHLVFANPAGEPMTVVARRDGVVLSYMMIVPARIRAFGAEGLAGHVIDAMTLPSWQRRGLRHFVSTEGRRLAFARGLLVTYAVANDQSLPLVVKYSGYAATGALPILVRPLRSMRAGLHLAVSWLQGRGAREERAPAPGDLAAAGPFRAPTAPACPAPVGGGWQRPAFDERHTDLFRHAEDIPSIAVIRDAAYLAWRYHPVAGVDYLQRNVASADRLAATIVVRTAPLYGLRLVCVMDWLWREGGRREGLSAMRDVIRLGRTAHADVIAALAMPGTPQRRLLRRLGFVPVPRFLFPRTSVLIIRPREEGEGRARWLEGANRYLTWGDGFLL